VSGALACVALVGGEAMSEHETQRRQREPKRAVVYFVEALGLDLVKIGFATRFRSRLYDLCKSNAAELRVIKTVCGTRRSEAALHRRFQLHRVRGEWFKLSAIRDAVDALSETSCPDEHRCCDCSRVLYSSRPTRCRACAGKLWARDVAERAAARAAVPLPPLLCIDCSAPLKRRVNGTTSTTQRCQSCGMRAAWASDEYRASIMLARAAAGVSRRRKCARCGGVEPRVAPGSRYHPACWLLEQAQRTREPGVIHRPDVTHAPACAPGVRPGRHV
jgi:hypothetical protein